jgi:hypothetical protein
VVTQGTILSQRYLLEVELGTGGMGTVYRAVDLRTGARVAVKIPHAFLIRNRQYVARLQREAGIAAALLSSRIARVTDFSEHEGIPYIVMEWVPGESLADRIARQGALPPAEAVRIALEVARALVAAHAAGIVHRDLKPDNIRLTHDGGVKVLDFGIARVQGQSGLTSHSQFLGSPDYAAPERADGMGDIRSDLYSLGVTLFEMLTGQLPFGSGTPFTIIRRHAEEPPRPLPFGLPAMLYAVVDRCLAKRPEARYQTPEDLVGDLVATLRQIERDGDYADRTAAHAAPPAAAPVDGPTVVLPPGGAQDGVAHFRPAAGPSAGTAPVPDPPRSAAAAPAADARPSAPAPSSARPPRGRSGRPRPRTPLLLLAALCVLALGGGALAAALRATRDRDAGATEAGPGITIVAPADGARLSGPVTVSVRADGLNLKAFDAGDPQGQHLHYFLDVDPTLVTGPGQPIPTGQTRIIHTPKTEQTFADLSPGVHTVWVVVTGNDHRPPVPTLQAKVTFAVLPDLTNARAATDAPIAYQSLVNERWVIVTMTGDGRNPRRITAGTANDLSPAWSPDGRQIAFHSDRDGQLRIYVMNADGSDVRRLTSGPGRDQTPAWSPDGRFIVFQSDRDGREHLYVVPAEGGEARQLTRGPSADAHPAWSPDGLLIAFQSVRNGRTRLYTVRADGGEPVEVQTGLGDDINPAWSPDGRRLAFASSREGMWHLYIVPAEGGPPRRLTDPQANANHLAPSWSPDGKQIVFQSDRSGQQQVFVMSVDGGPPRALTEGASFNQAPVWPAR